jgi:acyl carrier protein
MAELCAITEDLLKFVRASVDETGQVDETTDLLATGVIDSLLVADLTVQIEAAFGVTLSVRDISPENFRSVEQLARLVQAKQQRTRPAA